MLIRITIENVANLANTQSAQEAALFAAVGGLPALPAANTALYDSSALYPTGMSGPTTLTYYFPVTSAYSNITQPTEFRIYFYNNVNGFKEMQLNAFQLTGIAH